MKQKERLYPQKRSKARKSGQYVYKYKSQKEYYRVKYGKPLTKSQRRFLDRYNRMIEKFNEMGYKQPKVSMREARAGLKAYGWKDSIKEVNARSKDAYTRTSTGLKNRLLNSLRKAYGLAYYGDIQVIQRLIETYGLDMPETLKIVKNHFNWPYMDMASVDQAIKICYDCKNGNIDPKSADAMASALLKGGIALGKELFGLK